MEIIKEEIPCCEWSKPSKDVISKNDGDGDMYVQDVSHPRRRSLSNDRVSKESVYNVVEHTWLTVKLNRERQLLNESNNETSLFIKQI